MRGDIIFKINIKNVSIRLTKTQWNHISYRHPEIIQHINEIANTIKYPTYSIRKGEIIKYYKYIKIYKAYLMIAVKITNGDGFIITAYITKNIQK